jgi:2'-5' RNA ligase
MRAFLAVEFPEPVKAAIARLAERLKPAAKGAKWVPPAQLHVTLKFFEDISEAALPEVHRAVAEGCLKAAPFKVVIKGVGTFGPPAAPRVIWAGVNDGGGNLGALAELIAKRLEAAGFSREERPFSPHVTLCRFRQPSREPLLAATLRALADFECGSFEAKEAALFSSRLSPSGAVHSLLAKYPFKDR